MLAANGCSLDVYSNIFFGGGNKKKGKQRMVGGCVLVEREGGGRGLAEEMDG